jgi:hypothetical protein
MRTLLLKDLQLHNLQTVVDLSVAETQRHRLVGRANHGRRETPGMSIHGRAAGWQLAWTSAPYQTAASSHEGLLKDTDY